MRIILKNGEKSKKNRIFFLMSFILLISIFFSLLFIKFYSNNATPIIVNYSESEIEKLITLVINKSIGETTNKMDVNDLFIVRYNTSGEIILIDFDTKKSSDVLTGITNLIEYNLKELENGNVDYYKDYYNNYSFSLLRKGVIVEVPFGICFKSNFLNNIGPKIPVKISFARNVETGFSTEVVEYGINNALLKLNINIKIEVKVILPIISDNIVTDFSIPIAMKIIQGKIPSYYMDGFTTNSNIVKGD